MSWLFAWFQNDNVAELEKDREKLVEKKAQIEEEIKAIDERIEQLKSESKDQGSN